MTTTTTQFSCFPLVLKKRHPLVISRATRRDSNNLFVKVQQGDYVGIGEAIPDVDYHETIEDAQSSVSNFLNQHDFSDIEILKLWDQAKADQLTPACRAAVDMALWDLLAKQCHMPCYKLFGISKKPIVTSVTIGITDPELVADRVTELLQQTQAKALKIKLGSPAGIDVDQAMFLQVIKAAKPFNVEYRIDANGGWSLKDAITMIEWLAQYKIQFVEQPLAVGQEHNLKQLFEQRPLPIFVDESCYFAEDIPKVADVVDGINVKLMKCGGLTEALRMIATARAHELQTMIGCMSESSIAISAAAQVAPLFTYVDLDSHLNIINDPANGVSYNEGKLYLNNGAGHGASFKDGIQP